MTTSSSNMAACRASVIVARSSPPSRGLATNGVTEKTTSFLLSAAYGYGLARNHAFSDGNKRIAYVAADLFLALNGFRLVADEAEKIATFLALAAGDLSEDQLADWLRAHSRPA